MHNGDGHIHSQMQEEMINMLNVAVFLNQIVSSSHESACHIDWK